MGYQNVFQRYEIKYLITKQQKKEILNSIQEHIEEDAYGRSTICNIYFDTPDYLLIRRSIEGPIYKEKLRLRSYGIADSNSEVFVELKKKYKSVVYKRRVKMNEAEAVQYLNGGLTQKESQITHEIDYFIKSLPNLAPTVFLSYEREAFYAKDDTEFRITFDENILWRKEDVSLCKGIYGTPILDEGMVLMELKVAHAIPLWMIKVLSANKIYKTSFSKYGRAYEQIVRENTHEHQEGEIAYA